jgi:hypothetical protein
MVENGLGAHQNDIMNAIKALFSAGEVPYTEEADIVELF